MIVFVSHSYEVIGILFGGRLGLFTEIFEDVDFSLEILVGGKFLEVWEEDFVFVFIAIFSFLCGVIAIRW
jgi:hypothetical protein